jgi:aminotransferase
LEDRLSSRAKDVPPSGIRRFFEIAATMDDVISLGIGEPDFVSPPPIIDSGIRSLKSGKTSYTPNAGLMELREQVAGKLQELYGVEYDPESEMIITVGVSEALQVAMLALLDPGDEILIPEPCFVSYGPCAQFAGGAVEYVPTHAENGFQVMPEDIRARITSRSKVLFLAYPSNPTGAVLRRDTLQELIDLVVEHDLLVISDEIYDRLIYGAAYERGHVCLPAYEELRNRTILMGGFSKNYAMTGWRIGYACAPEPLLQAMYMIHQYVIMSAPTISQEAAVTAVEECEAHVEEMRQAYDRRRRYIVDGLRSAGLPTTEPEGAFYCFPDVRPTGLSSEQFAKKLLREQRVACVPGDAFGSSGRGYVRCSYATSMEQIKIAIDRITEFVKKYA